MNEFIKNIILNISVLVAITILYTINIRNKNNRAQEILIGIFIGMVGIFLISISVKVDSGIFFDSRSILVCISGMFLGLLPTTIAVTIIAGYRWLLEGSGYLAGMAVTIVTAGVGVLWHFYRKDVLYYAQKSMCKEFYLVGVVAHIGMLLCMLLLPNDKILAVLSEITLPVLIFYPIGLLLICRIIFNQISLLVAKNDLERKESLYRSLFEYAPIGIAILIKNKIQDVNEYFLNVLGGNIEEIRGKELKEVIIDIDFEKELKEKSLIEKRYLKADGSIGWLDVDISEIKNLKEENEHICIVQDITEKKNKEDRIKYVTYHDLLTGLKNRNAFEEECRKKMKNVTTPFSIIAADIDGLKLINDAFGHDRGDLVLKLTGQILKSTVEDSGVIFRTGGDEFYIFLEKTNTDSAKYIMKKINEAIVKVNEAEHDIILNVSLGLSTLEYQEDNFKTILKQAEENMYRMKLLNKNSFYSEIVHSIKTTLYEKSNETEQHAERIAQYSLLIGKEVGLSKEELNSLELASILHDIGKISIDLSILTKSEKLTDEEWQTIKKHSEKGYRITYAIPELKHIAEYILCHHERWDGKGYPQGLAGEAIPLISRIISIADSFDAMIDNRPYKKALTKDEALAEIEKNAGTQFDPELAMIFLRLMRG